MIIRKEKDAMILFSWSDFDQNICENLNPWLKKLSSKISSNCTQTFTENI